MPSTRANRSLSPASPDGAAPGDRPAASRYINSFYKRTIAEDRPRPPLAGQRQVEVCVIGGGLAGLSAALGLVERGVSVALVEARRIAWGASGRNGGFVSPGFSLSPGEILSQLGPDHARQLYDLSLEAVERVRRRISEFDLPGVPAVTGRLKVLRYDDPDRLVRQKDMMAEVFGVQWELWTRERLREALVTERYHHALSDPRGFHFHPLNYALGIAAVAESKGLEIFEDTPAIRLDLLGAEKTVATPGGVIKAKHLVVACGGYIAGLESSLSGATLPVATYIVTTEPLGDRIDEAIRIPHAVSDTRLAGNYFRAIEGGRILWGGKITARTREPRRLAEDMIADLVSVFPQLEGVRAEDAWMGLMGYPVHKMPQLGQHLPGVWHSMGYGGHGMSATALGGELIAAAIAEGDDRYRLFEPYGLRWTGGRIVGAMAAQTAYWYYQFVDRIQERRGSA